MPIAEGVEAHQGAHPFRGTAGGKKRPAQEPKRYEEEVDEGVEALGGIHRPSNKKSQGG